MKIEVRKPTAEEVERMNDEPIWECGVKNFPWSYNEREVCLIMEGEVTVRTREGEVSFGPGDLVTFPQGLSCEWRVKKPVKKHYRFG